MKQQTENEVDEAFTRIYESTYPEVLRFVAAKCSNCADVSDILQSAYLNFYNRIKTKGLGHIREPKHYLLRIARDEVYRHYGYLSMLRRSIPAFSPGVELPAEAVRFLEDDSLEDKLDASELWERIAQKDETTVSILTLYFVGGLKLGEIARRIGENESFVKNRLYRTLRELRAEFTEKGE